MYFRTVKAILNYNIMKRLTALLAAVAAVTLTTAAYGNDGVGERQFVEVKDGCFVRGGSPYYYVGANMWYGAILGSTGEGGNRARLRQELDSLKAIGVTNLRVLAGADGPDGVAAKVEPALQTAPGVYNDALLDGLDYMLAEMGRRGMTTVIYLNNAWEWSGGYGQYIEWSGAGRRPVPAVDGWPAYMDYVKRFVMSPEAKALFARHVRNIVSRTNRYTGVRYADDPTIMSWQICNEPRAFSTEGKDAFAKWIADVAALIDSLAPRQLISTGSEGKHGCEEDISLFERIHAVPQIDYLNIHIWPYNWGWARKDSITHDVERAKAETKKYIDEHAAVARRLGKPVVLEEFGYPRDGFSFSKDAPTTARDSYYAYVFGLVEQSAKAGGKLAGCNFWAWGGTAEPSKEHVFWQRGDDYTGDPAQEEQGLNSVFASDTYTMTLIRHANDKLSRVGQAR